MPSAFPYCSIFFLFLNSVASFQIPRFLAESEKKCRNAIGFLRRKLGWSLRSVNGWILPGYHIAEIFLKCLDKTNRLEFVRWYLTFLVDLWWSHLLSLVLIFGYFVNIVFCVSSNSPRKTRAAPWCWGDRQLWDDFKKEQQELEKQTSGEQRKWTDRDEESAVPRAETTATEAMQQGRPLSREGDSSRCQYKNSIGFATDPCQDKLTAQTVWPV